MCSCIRCIYHVAAADAAASKLRAWVAHRRSSASPVAGAKRGAARRLELRAPVGAEGSSSLMALALPAPTFAKKPSGGHEPVWPSQARALSKLPRWLRHEFSSGPEPSAHASKMMIEQPPPRPSQTVSRKNRTAPPPARVHHKMWAVGLGRWLGLAREQASICKASSADPTTRSA